MKAIQDVVLREIGGDWLLIPQRQEALRLHGMFHLSESGYLLWCRLQSECTERELVAAILAEYETDEATACADVHAFVAELQRRGLLLGSGEVTA